MRNSSGCAETRLLLPELALGTLAGHERARALDHVASCADCRAELVSLGEVGDQLLLLGPLADPPPAFESRILERLATEAPRPRSRARSAAMVAAALVVAGVLGGTAVYLAGAGSRDLAAGYRRTLDVADGRYVAARALVGDREGAVGYVFGYEGSPSWIFCVVRAGSDGTYDVEVSAGGTTRIVGEIQVHGGRGAWHRILEVDLQDLRRVRLIERSGREVLVAMW